MTLEKDIHQAYSLIKRNKEVRMYFFFCFDLFDWMSMAFHKYWVEICYNIEKHHEIVNDRKNECYLI